MKNGCPGLPVKGGVVLTGHLRDRKKAPQGPWTFDIQTFDF